MTLEWRSAAEWRDLCAAAGLKVIASHAGFEGVPLRDQPGDHVFVCKRS